MQEDNLSLLRGMGEKEVKGYARKGILTLTQLAHTFRPRRKGKRAGAADAPPLPRPAGAGRPGQEGLRLRHARAARQPRSRSTSTSRAMPDEGFVYLIGMIVVEDGTETTPLLLGRHARNRRQEIFEQFLAEVGRYDDFLVFCYGGYERAFLKRMRKTATRKEPVDRVLDALVNVLSRGLRPRLLPLLLQRAEGRGRLPGLLVDRAGGVGPPEHRLAEAVGGEPRPRSGSRSC